LTSARAAWSEWLVYGLPSLMSMLPDHLMIFGAFLLVFPGCRVGPAMAASSWALVDTV